MVPESVPACYRQLPAATLSKLANSQNKRRETSQSLVRTSDEPVHPIEGLQGVTANWISFHLLQTTTLWAAPSTQTLMRLLTNGTEGVQPLLPMAMTSSVNGKSPTQVASCWTARTYHPLLIKFGPRRSKLTVLAKPPPH